jgi:hypothetical protein
MPYNTSTMNFNHATYITVRAFVFTDGPVNIVI